MSFVLKPSDTLTQCGRLASFLYNDECHPIEAMLQLVFTEIRFVFHNILIRVLVHLGNYRQLLWVFEVKEKFDWPLATSHAYRLSQIAADNDVRRC